MLCAGGGEHAARHGGDRGCGGRGQADSEAVPEIRGRRGRGGHGGPGRGGMPRVDF